MQKLRKTENQNLSKLPEYAKREEVVDVMKHEKKNVKFIGKGLIATLLFAVLLMAGLPVYAGCPAANATVDTDNDGFTDEFECTGPYPFLNPDIPDLFVIIVRDSPTTYIPAQNPLQYLNTIVAAHEIDINDVGPDLSVPGTIPIQRALMITEDSDEGAGGEYLGELPWGNLPNIISGSIYTKDIVDFVSGKFDTGIDQAVIQDAYEDYIRYVLAHEFGHGMRLAAKYTDKYNGYHFSTRDNVVMQENAVVSTKGKTAPTFYLPTDWGTESLATFKLK